MIYKTFQKRILIFLVLHVQSEKRAEDNYKIFIDLYFMKPKPMLRFFNLTFRVGKDFDSVGNSTYFGAFDENALTVISQGENDPGQNPLEAIRLLRWAIASIWSGLDVSDLEQTDECISTICRESLALTASYETRQKDLTDDSMGLESWRRNVNSEGRIIKRF